MRQITKQQTTLKSQLLLLLKKAVMCLVILCLLILFVLIGWGIHTNYFSDKWNAFNDSAASLMKNVGFEVDDVLINGRVRTSMDEINKALEAPTGKLITSLDLKQMQQNLERLPWIKSASIYRQLPSLLIVDIQERTPIALWQHKNKHYPLDEDGNVVYAPYDNVSAYLIVVVGGTAPKSAPYLIKALMKYPELYERVQGAVWIGSRRWNLYITDNNHEMIVKLPEGNLDASLKRLNALDQKEHIFNKQIKILDLRLADRTIVELDTKESVILPKKEKK